MATSTNYGWAEPDNSSLVKNGASDIRTLGNAIDTSVWNVGKGQAGKNKIINGDFSIWQRGSSFSTTGYTADRWYTDFAGASAGTISRQAFTAGTAPVSGYEAQYFLRRNLTTGAQYSSLVQRIEDVRTFAGQTVTVSFWAKGTNPTGNFEANLIQNFGSGGSSEVALTGQSLTLTGSWVRYSYNFTLGAMTGKTIGTGSYLYLSIYQAAVNASVSTLDIWGVQVELGSLATPFQTASGGSQQAELAMCQRYYWRSVSGGAYGTPATSGFIDSTTNAILFANLPVTMRVAPTAIEYSSIQVLDSSNTAITPSNIVLNTARSTTNVLSVDAVITGGTAGRFAYSRISNTSSGYLAATAEL